MKMPQLPHESAHNSNTTNTPNANSQLHNGMNNAMNNGMSNTMNNGMNSAIHSGMNSPMHNGIQSGGGAIQSSSSNIGVGVQQTGSNGGPSSGSTSSSGIQGGVGGDVLSYEYLLSGIGHTIASGLQQQLQKNINKAIGWNSLDEFPGSIPTPFIRSDFGKLEENSYFVCERSEGVSQNYEFRSVELMFPIRSDRLQPGIDKNSVLSHNWTILDGEITFERESGKFTPHFLIYDVLMLNGHSLINLPLPDRLKAIQNDVIAPRKSTFLPPETFQLSLQSLYPVKRLPLIIKEIIPRLNRENAGLIFIPVAAPYQLGLSKTVLVWRPPVSNFVDFQLGVEWRGRPPMPGFKVMAREKRLVTFHDWITLESNAYDRFKNDPKAPSRILECIFDLQQATFIPSHDKTSWDHGNPEIVHPDRGVGWRAGGWRFVRVREDKSFPSDISIVNAVESSLEDPLSFSDFINFFSDDPAKVAQYKVYKEVNPVEANKKKRPSPETRNSTTVGVCYDFQNKGVCRRGDLCHFSHCACDTFCSCTRDSNSYGHRPFSRREEVDDVGKENSDKPSSILWASSSESGPPIEPPKDHVATSNAAEHSVVSKDAATIEKGGLGTHVSVGLLDKQSIDLQRGILSSSGNARIWSNMGITFRDRVKRNIPSFTVSSSGQIMNSRAISRPNSDVS